MIEGWRNKPDCLQCSLLVSRFLAFFFFFFSVTCCLWRCSDAIRSGSLRKRAKSIESALVTYIIEMIDCIREYAGACSCFVLVYFDPVERDISVSSLMVGQTILSRKYASKWPDNHHSLHLKPALPRTKHSCDTLDIHIIFQFDRLKYTMKRIFVMRPF